MFSLRYLLNPPYGFHEYVWLDVLLIKETQKAILIKFDGRKIWLPKAWIMGIKRSKDKSNLSLQALSLSKGEAISIKISQYHWTKKL